jgi:hypothetical protein
VLSNLNAVISLFVLVELARRSFSGAGKLGSIIGTLVVLAGGVATLVFWGPWPSWLTLTAQSQYETIRLMQLTADKVMLFSGVLTIELGLLVTLLGRRFGAGWRSHAQRIMVGLSTAALAQLALRGVLQAIGTHTVIHTQAEYEKVLGLRDKLINADKVVYLCVLLWWIACLWIDEPGDSAAALDTEPEAETDAETEMPAELEAKGETAEEIGETSGEHGPDSREN